jgi:hypothetical protein
MQTEMNTETDVHERLKLDSTCHACKGTGSRSGGTCRACSGTRLAYPDPQTLFNVGYHEGGQQLKPKGAQGWWYEQGLCAGRSARANGQYNGRSTSAWQELLGLPSC